MINHSFEQFFEGVAELDVLLELKVSPKSLKFELYQESIAWVSDFCDAIRIGSSYYKKEQDSKAVYFWFWGILLLFDDLRRGVSGSPCKTAAYLIAISCQTEIDQERSVVVADQDVLCFDVPMKNIFAL